MAFALGDLGLRRYDTKYTPLLNSLRKNLRKITIEDVTSSIPEEVLPMATWKVN